MVLANQKPRDANQRTSADTFFSSESNSVVSSPGSGLVVTDQQQSRELLVSEPVRSNERTAGSINPQKGAAEQPEVCASKFKLLVGFLQFLAGSVRSQVPWLPQTCVRH